jgi:hypothetical protein
MTIRKGVFVIWSLTIFNKMATSNFLSDVSGIKGLGGQLPSDHFLLFKKGTRSLDFQSNEPPLKFMRRPFYMRCLWGECGVSLGALQSLLTLKK